MKIVYIANSIIPSQTANSIHIMKMCQAFALNGHEVFLLLPNKIDSFKIDDIYDFYGVKNCFKIIRISYPKIIGGVFIFSLLSVIKAFFFKADLVYTRFLYASFLGLVLKLPAILEVHSPEFITKIDRAAFNWIAKNKLGKIVVISQALKNILADEYRVSRNKILVAPDGADPVNDNIKPSKLNKKSGHLTIGYIGHLYKGRGIDIIAELARLCSWAEFHIIGGLPQDVDYWKKELAKFQNIILYGHVPHKEVYEYMLSFDALIAPYQEKVSVYGGAGNTVKWMSPLKIFEYMATGKTILASDLPALREILKHNQNSLLASPGDIEKWKLNLELIRSNGSLKRKLGKKAKEDFENNYTWKSRAKKVLKLLQ